MIDDAQRNLIESGGNNIFFRTRLRKTMKLMQSCYRHTVLDLGGDNLMRRILAHELEIEFVGTGEMNLDNFSPTKLIELTVKAGMCTAFEILEHLVNPYLLLHTLSRAGMPLIATVPLRFPLSKQYWGKDKYDRHYNEFEPRQFQWLLNEAGYDILHEEYWKLPLNFVGLRPFLRAFIQPTWMAVLAIPKDLD